ncbi:helix-turn-helix domain-containing protein [Rothia koreensis]|uniref:helix-turn-helix domain-containing protein n=1 Tax=Rothia koreensis TaxID=592378 RepID=UPI003FCEA76F
MIAEADRAYSISNAADQLGVSRGTVYNLVNRGHLKTVSYPGIEGMRITSKELARFLDRCQKAT